MTPNEAAQKAKEIVKTFEGDTEHRHVLLDNLLLEVLKEHGYIELVEIFEKQPMWYA